MKRLSYKDANGQWAVDDWERGITQRGLAIDRLAAFENICFAPDETERISIVRLRELAEADKDGRCVVLPCKVGNTVYYPFCGRVLEKTVTAYRRIFDARSGVPDVDWWYELNGNQDETMDEDSIGKTVFLTREAAEAALEAADMKNEEK